MIKTPLYFSERLWLDRAERMAKELEYDYVITWWLREEYASDFHPYSTSMINAVFRNIERKGYVKIETTKSYTKVMFNQSLPNE